MLNTLLIFCRAADVQEKLHIEAMEKCEADFTNSELEERLMKRMTITITLVGRLQIS